MQTLIILLMAINLWRPRVPPEHRTVLEPIINQVGWDGVMERITNVKQDLPKIEYSEKGDSASLECKSSFRITSLDGLLEKANVDLTKWMVDRFVINKWEVGSNDGNGNILVEPLWQVKAWLKRNAALADFQALREQFVTDASNHAPKYSKVAYKPQNTDPCLLELSIYDQHLGKLAWAPETGEDYDTDIAGTLFLEAVDNLLTRARGSNIERIVFPVGNDFLNTDNKNNTTTNGTVQDCDTRYQKMFTIGRRVLVSAIEKAMSIAPVDVIVVPGNHDFERMYYIGEALQGWFSKCPDVTVNNDPRSRKYYEYGKNMILFTHGNNEKHANLPLIMAQEQPEMWSRTKFRETHMGHLHGKHSVKFQEIQENQGVRVRILPSLCPPDAWHSLKAFSGNIRSSEAFIWHKERGIEGQFNYNL